ncbi:MAG TPA: hypothetical protein PKK06_06940 [Phycisphaerae bacterium]|nr:hypothetical protein [Phycisphaerae bacterium]HNU46905.1 hypothetical protein [Phycisphaerae bacterium]
MGDGESFTKVGVCALTVMHPMCPWMEPFHTDGDTYAKVDRRATTESAAVLAVLARRLADAAERPTERLKAPGGQRRGD